LQKLQFLLQQSTIYSEIIGQKMAKERENLERRDRKEAEGETKSSKGVVKPEEATTSRSTRSGGAAAVTSTAAPAPTRKQRGGNKGKRRKTGEALITDVMDEEVTKHTRFPLRDEITNCYFLFFDDRN
jgi:hypothetical protein